MSEQPQESYPQLDRPPVRKNQKRFLIIGGAILLLIILAGSTYLAGYLMNNNASNQNASHVIPAAELPADQEGMRGVFLSRSGNTFTFGTGSIEVGMHRDESGQVTAVVNSNGPTYEVVITRDTRIYKDTTWVDPTTQVDPGSSGSIQQTLAPGTLDDFNATTTIIVWGRKTGDRYVADVIVYKDEFIKLQGGGGGKTK